MVTLPSKKGKKRSSSLLKGDGLVRETMIQKQCFPINLEP
jgi:hypothetical protein